MVLGPSNVPKTKGISRIHNGHWQFEEQMGDGVGFIYVIRDMYMEKLYLGKKQYRVMRGVNKGKESNWKKYISSSKILQETFMNRPDEEFEFICLEEYKTKGGLRYAETWSLCYVDALCNSLWLNGQIEKITWKVTEPVTERHKANLNKILNWEDFKCK